MKLKRSIRTLLRSRRTIVATALLGVVIPWSSTLGGPNQTTSGVIIEGIVRDFSNANTDFKQAPSGGNGHYAGNVWLALGSDDVPVFEGGGFKVASQWRDKYSNPIAPHLYMYYHGSPGEVLLTNAPSYGSHLTIDTYNSDLGPYGGANIGPAPTFVTGVAMPDIAVPRSLSALTSQGDLSYGSATISENVHCDSMDISGTLTIDGNLSILCDGDFYLGTHAGISLTSGSTLRLYLLEGGASWNHVLVGDSLNPERVIIYNGGTANFMIHNHAEVYAHIISPDAQLELKNHGALFGQFMGKQMKFSNHANFHVDKAPPGADLCGNTMLDTPGTEGVTSSGGIASAAHFAQWFDDALGVNVSGNHSITLNDDGTGVYEYLDDAFLPIDGLHLGNEGDEHNYYFTYTFTVEFVHHECDDRFFEFNGADDAWLFVDGQLALDIGGIIPDSHQRIDMDRMSLTDGATYRLHFFYAQRNGSTAVFRVRTNLDLLAEPYVVTVTPTFD